MTRHLSGAPCSVRPCVSGTAEVQVSVLEHPEPLPISLVAHHVFCPRRAWLEAMGEQTDTHQVAVGLRAHTASDDPSASRSDVRRAVDVGSVAYGVIGRCDAVRTEPDGRVTVIEYKATPVRRRAEVTEPMVVQLTLQVEALREAGADVAGAAVHFTEHRQTVPVTIGPQERILARSHVEETERVLASDDAPPPLEDDPRCMRCSHAGLCLPDERRLQPVHRRVLVSDPDTQVLHLTTPGSRASTRSGRILVAKAGEQLASAPLERVLAVVVHGNVDLSGGLIRELLWRDLPVVWCSSSGRVIGWASSSKRPNGGPRVKQHVASATGHLELARAFVRAKIGNQATLLRRHGDQAETVANLRKLQRRTGKATSIPELYGIEGDAAARYFSAFASMLSSDVVQQGLTLSTRTRRPARDPVNAALNFCYGMLVADLIRAIASCGLDPHAGFLHSSSRNKPALALDLAEEFRAPVADSVVITALNNGELRATDFSDVTGTTTLRERGRSSLIAAYERRVSTTFTHPLFKYDVTWRRAMEIQARLVLGVLDGTQPSYRGIATR